GAVDRSKVAGGPGRVAQAFDLAGITNTVGCHVLRVLGEGRVPRTHTQRGLCRTDKSCVGIIATRPRKKRTGHPRSQLPAAIQHISDPQIPLTRLKKNGVAVIFHAPERLSDNRTTKSPGPLTYRKRATGNK